jgi:dTDP-glucose pyrophosphorylase
LLKKLKSENYKIYVASNSIRETTKLLLFYTGLLEYVDFYISNEDVKNPKPNPEMYLRCMIDAEVSPDETLIIEDSPRGIEAARNAKSHLLIVRTPDDLSYEKIHNSMNNNIKNKIKINDLNILIPMAGLGSRFEKLYSYPKPLIDIYGKTMIQVVVDDLGIDANYIYVVRKEHCEKYNLKTLLNVITPNCKIVQVDKVTEGAACTTLLSEEYINNDDMLMIANSDQFIHWNPMNFYYKMIETKADGGILTFESNHPKWSYVKLNDKGVVELVAEKNPISNRATVGIYWYKKGSDYVKYAKQMINKNIRVNNEFYVAPIYNEFISDNKKIVTYDVDKMMGLGDPESLESFLREYKKEDL